jgi:flotillin
MAFRDDRAAAHHRADALERELAAAKEGNEELRRELDEARSGVVEPGMPGYKPSFVAAGVGLLVIGGSLIAAGLGVGFMPLVLLGAMVAMSAVPVFFMSRLLVVVPPGMMAVVTGRNRMDAAGQVQGFRVVLTGRIVRVPLIERIDFMDARVMEVPIEVARAFIKGGGAVDINATAMVRIETTEPGVKRAIGRFLGYTPEKIAAIADDTIRGDIRTVVAELAAEQLEEREKLEELVVRVAGESLDELGLRLESVKVHELSGRD